MKMKRMIMSLALTAALGVVSFAAYAQDGGFPRVSYDDVRIKEFPVAVHCWTFNKFTFVETLDKVRDLGVRYLQPYRGQKLSAATGDAVFGPEMTDEQVKMVREKLIEYGISLVSYGVVNFNNDEASMRAVFDFARKMGIKTIVTEPQYDDWSQIGRAHG